MRKLAVLAFLIASSLHAQVVIGKGVQIGGTASGSSFTLNWLSGNVTLSVGSGLNLTNSGNTLGLTLTGGAGITQLTGDVTAAGSGSVVATLANTSVSPGNYNLGGQIVAVNSQGRITAIGNPFGVSFSSCSACGTFEIGNATTSPATFGFSYANGTPASGTVGDGTNTTTLTTPFTSGSIAAQYCTTGQGQAAFTFTVNATATNGQSANSAVSTQCAPRAFAGVGTAGATGATASGTNAVLVGATGTLPSAGLGNPASYGPLSPLSQKIYVLNTSGSCTFKDESGFDFPMNTPTSITFVNAFGASLGYWIYQSSSELNQPFTLVATC